MFLKWVLQAQSISENMLQDECLMNLNLKCQLPAQSICGNMLQAEGTMNLKCQLLAQSFK